MPRRPILVALLIAVTASLTLPLPDAYTAYTPGDGGGDAWSLWLKTYNVVAEISRLGGDPGKYVNVLNETYRLIRENKTNEAYSMLVETYRDAYHEYISLKQEVIYRRILYYLPILGILLIPIVFHALFPRIYLALWFRARRDWVVEE